MIFAADVQYFNSSANAGAILFDDWLSESPVKEWCEFISPVASYEPGEFYKRELPCLIKLLTPVIDELSAIVIDGYVFLGEDQRPGLGAKLNQELNKSLNKKIPIIGVAKNYFSGTPEQCFVNRGKSKKPLYVSAVNLSLEDAKLLIKSMHGQHRIPTLLKQVDSLCRSFKL